MNIQEVVLIVTREDEEESIKDANNVIADKFSLASNPQRENLDAIFASEKLKNSNELSNAVSNMTINDVEYELNKVTMSDAQVEFASYPETYSHQERN